MLLSRQAALQSYRRANTNTVSLRHSRATRGTSARRGASTRLPLAEGGTIGGSPPKPPQQEKGAAEGDGDENKTQGWYQAAVQAVGWAQPFLLPAFTVGTVLGGTAAFFAAVGAGLGRHSNIATRADVKESEGRILNSIQDLHDSVKESEGRILNSIQDLHDGVKESEGRIFNSIQDLHDGVKESEGRILNSIQDVHDSLKESVDSLKGTVGILQACGRGQFITLVIAGAFAAGRRSK